MDEAVLTQIPILQPFLDEQVLAEPAVAAAPAIETEQQQQALLAGAIASGTVAAKIRLPPLPCSQCGAVFPKQHQRQRHTCPAVTSVFYQCTQAPCAYGSNSKYNLSMHLSRKHGIRKRRTIKHPTREYKCTAPNCSMVCVHSSSLNRHIRTFHQDQTEETVCRICNEFRSKRRDLVMQHEKDAHNQVNCPKCNKTYGGYRQLKAHDRSVHGNTASL